jgi:hypothetical protein
MSNVDERTEVSTDLGQSAEILGDVSVEMIPHAIVEAVEPFKMHPTSISYIYKVFEHLKQLWMRMGIWQHTHTVTTTEVSSDLGYFLKS